MSKSRLRADWSHVLRAQLGDWLCVRHLSQPLQSIDVATDVASQLADLQPQAITVFGVVEQGRVVGSLPREMCDADDWRAQIVPITHDQVIDDDAPLLHLLLRLQKRHWLFVRYQGDVEGFVSRSDLQRPPFRMLLFGFVSLFEMRLLHLVEQHYTESQIESTLNQNRLEKAWALHAERKRRGEELRLVDCLQIADKRDLVLALPHSASLLGCDSNNQAARFMGHVEALRDRLVHANDLIAGSTWETVLGVTLELADFLAQAGQLTGDSKQDKLHRQS